MAVEKKYFVLILWLLYGSVIARTDPLDSLKNIWIKAEKEEKIFACYDLAEYFLEKNIDSSIYYGKQLVAYSQKTNDPFGEALGNFILGTYYDKKGEYLKAIHHQQAALEIFQREKDTASVAKTLLNLGIEFHSLGNFEKALIYYQEAEKYSNLLKDNYLNTLILLNSGRLYEDWKRYETALEYYKEALRYARESGLTETEEILLHNIAVEYNNLRQYDSAVLYLDSALRLCKKLGLKEGLFYVYYDYGNSFLGLEDINRAGQNFSAALKIAGELHSPLLTAKALYKTGVVFQRKKRFAKAVDYYQRAFAIVDTIGEHKLARDLLLALSEVFKENQDYANALKYYEKYSAVEDSLFQDKSHKLLVDMQVKYETDKKEKEIEIQRLKIARQESKYFNTVLLAAGLLLLLSVISLLFFNRYKYRQQQARTLLEKQNIEIEQRLLRTQMNPHFIFNSLHSISNFIMTNKSSVAQEYLAKFARLMRLILENSRKKMTALEDEIETLQLYMELERLRFGGKFDFNISVAEDIDTGFTFIPPMLIQPFVENSILHGLAPKERDGLIAVSIKKGKELMEIVIEDNGIGRKAAAERQKGKRKKNKSLGMQVTKERIDILKENTGLNVTLEIIDLFDVGKPAGTRVVLRIPYEEE